MPPATEQAQPAESAPPAPAAEAQPAESAPPAPAAEAQPAGSAAPEAPAPPAGSAADAQPAPGPLTTLDAAAILRWALRCRDDLAAARQEIDDLNVYPVPDGDTGTNLHLTVEAAVEALEQSAASAGTGASGRPGGSPRDLCAALAHGALLAARGNSGVILSQLVRGVADALPADETVGPGELATALDAGAAAAYAAVAQPVEGTMLTVARAAAAAATSAATSAERGLAAVANAAAEAAREALRHTPEQLEVLRRAGVVDAGGRGVCVVLDALADIVTGRRPVGDRTGGDSAPPGGTTPAGPGAAAVERARRGGWSGPAAGGPAYEVMFLLDAPASAVPQLRAALADLGDSLVVVGGEPTWNVHVHVDDAGAAIEAGMAAGRPHRIRVTHLADAARPAETLPDDGTRGVVSVVAGDGLAALFEAAGATVVRGGPGRRASTAEVLEGIRRARARSVVVLPNDADSHGVAEAAAATAREEGLRVGVVPTRATVQAIAALAVHDPERRFEDDVLAMTAAAGHCRHGGVTVAARQAVTMAGVCSPGDVLGIVDGDFAVIGDDLAAVACEVADRMLAGGGELVTLVTGEHDGADVEALARTVADHLRRTRPEVDTVVYEGGQPRYPLLIGVE